MHGKEEFLCLGLKNHDQGKQWLSLFLSSLIKIWTKERKEEEEEKKETNPLKVMEEPRWWIHIKHIKNLYLCLRYTPIIIPEHSRMLNNKFFCWTTDLMWAEAELNGNFKATAGAEVRRTCERIRRPGLQASFSRLHQGKHLTSHSLPSCVMRRLENETFSSKICSYDCLWCILRFVCGLQRLPDSDKKNVPFPTLSPSQLPHLTRSPSEQLSWSFVQNPAAVQSWLQVYQAVFCVLFPRWHWRCCPVFPRTHPECCSLATKRPSHHLYKLPLPEVQGLLNASG